MKLYEAYADEIADLIRQGVLPPGARLPSVRQTKQQRKVSASTVFEAYNLLESRGLIHCRPRSGYYVNEHTGPQAPEPHTATPAAESHPVAISGLVFDVLGSSRNVNMAPLGSAFASPHLFPLDKLAKALTPQMRNLPPARLIEHLTAGDESLRRLIALRYGSAGHRLKPDELVITNGAMEALNLSLQAITQPGDVVVLESPTFYAALQVLERLKLRAVEVATHPRTGVDLDSLSNVLRQHPVKACWLMPQFQNPLGSLMPVEAKQALVRLLAQHQVPLIEDDVYGELYFGHHRTPPAKAFDTEGLVLHCSSFSKSLAPGYRVGWVAAGRFAQAIGRIKLMSSLATAVPSQLAIAAYLETGGFDRHLRQMRLRLEDNANTALRCIARYFPMGTKVTRPQGGYFLWVELPPEINALDVHRRAADAGISVAPGQLFSANQRFHHHLRLNYGFHDLAELAAALQQLGALLRP
ncbi:PLP-dependent aminotransferase family protein [Curvibacter sp. CHRR-16]|uniref:aminotransferase-like domain-containing protein n=1 Tax=Curvibacter sp. CHRR-16 TaxID=2835872 RepID=UPI001BDA5675|nr:PLP-dependent aminotransferase family protein [Curvibacter sp. CHRR-16]MBT0570919.1 PLP-dependent aminotransferase family protein [Curvibacter sp. CHRR-16]